MKIRHIKFTAVTLFVLPVLMFTVFRTTTEISAAAVVEEPAAAYRAKCMACHTAKAEKFFDPAKADAEHIQIVLKGKKGEKPPFMPGYEAKGMTEGEAKTLVDYMKELRAPK